MCDSSLAYKGLQELILWFQILLREIKNNYL